MIDDARLARLLVETGRLAPEKVEALLEEQRKSPAPRRLSEVLVERGLVSADDLRRLAAPYEPTQVASPRTLGKFRLEAELGRGGMGVVYRAWQEDLERRVALKVLPATADATLKERFLREARTASRLRHPNIVTVHELGESEGVAFFTMDLVDGVPFDAFLRRAPREQAVRALAALARALDYAHGQGVVHRDIKPQNILVGAGGTPYLTDFGLARDVNAQAPLTVSGQILGTPAYMSPEQARGGRAEVGRASDVYSLGAVLYVALAGRPPFEAESVYDLLDAIIRRPPEPPSRKKPGVPAALEAACLRCLEKDPARRFSTARELAETLERALEAPEASPRRRRVPIAAAAAGVLAAAALVLWALFPSTEGEPGPRGERLELRSVGPNPGAFDDWEVVPIVLRSTRPFGTRREGSRLFVQNGMARFQAPLEGDFELSATVERAGPAGALGLAAGGYRLERRPEEAVFLAPSGAEVARRPPPAAAGPERLTLRLAGGAVAAEVGGKEIYRGAPPEPARPLRPLLLATQDGAARFSDVALRFGAPRGWAEEASAERLQLARVGKAYALGPAQDLLAGGATGRFQLFEQGTAKREGDVLRITTLPGAKAELHGPFFRTSRLRLEYQAHTARGLSLRVRAGAREVNFILPADEPERWRLVEITALEDVCTCRLDGSVTLSSSESNGVNHLDRLLRLVVRDGEASFRNVRVEEISGLKPGDPWTLLAHHGATSGLDMSAGWRRDKTMLVGAGELRSQEAWEDFEMEAIFEGRKGTRVSIGFRGGERMDAEPLSADDVTSSYDFRARGSVAELEELVWLDTRSRRRKEGVPGGAGPLVLKVEGGELRLISLRVRPLRETSR